MSERSYTLREAEELLGGAVKLEALRKRVQRPESPTGIRSVMRGNVRLIPLAELRRAFPEAFDVVGEQVAKAEAYALRLAEAESLIVSFRLLEVRAGEEADKLRQAAEEEARRRVAAEEEAATLRSRLEQLEAASWWERRRLRRSSIS